VNQTIVEPADVESAESLFRRVMAGATDGIWNLGADEEALAALYDVMDEGTGARKPARSTRTLCLSSHDVVVQLSLTNGGLHDDLCGDTEVIHAQDPDRHRRPSLG
jgi:hypothetical protein